MTIFQIISVLFAIFMMYVVSIHGKKKTLTLIEVSFWTTLWALFIILAIFPHLLLGIAGILRFSRVFDLLVIMALTVLSLLVFSNYYKQKELAKKIEITTRELAITKPLKQPRSKRV